MAAGLRVVFMGTPNFAATALKSILESRHEVVAVYSQPPRPKGRGQQVQKSAVHLLAEENNIPVFTPKNFKSAEDVNQFQSHNADVAVVAAYGLILPQVILDAPKYGCLNIHGSLLPRWRGAAPIHRAIQTGDNKTGITIMQMEAGLDTGPMIKMDSVAINDDTTTGVLHDSLASLGAAMIVDVLNDLEQSGALAATPQPDAGVTYAEKISKEEARIDWSLPAAMIERTVRAFHPYPATWSMDGDGKRIKILSVQKTPAQTTEAAGTIIDKEGCVACGDGQVLRLISLQPEGKKPMDITSALNGGFLKVGERLS